MDFKLSVLFLALLSTSVYCEQKKSIVGELLASKYTGFVKLLEQANLLEELDAEAAKHNGLTILPTTDNYLLNKVSPVLLSWLKKEQNIPTLRRVLLNHFIPGQVYPHQLTGNERTLVGTNIDRRVLRGVHFLGGVPVKQVAALKASDGVAHSLDGLLVPEDIKLELASFLSDKSEDSFTRSFVGWERVNKMTTAAESPSVPITPEIPSPVLPSESPVTSPPTPDVPSPDTSPSVSPDASPADAPSSSPESSPVESPVVAPAPGPASSSLSELINILNSTGDFTSFLRLLEQYGADAILDLQLSKDTTVLAPNDFAFSKVSASDLESLRTAGNIDELILFHVINGYASVKGFQTGEGSISNSVSQKADTGSATYQYETLYPNHPLLVNVTNGVVTFGPSGASAVSPDLLANGKLSVSGLDAVMIPDDLLIKANAPSSSGYLSVNKMCVLIFAIASLFFAFY